MKLSGSKRLKMLFALLPFMTIIFYILTSGSGSFAIESYKPPVLDKSIVETLDKPSSGKAGDFSPIENLKIAAGILAASSYFEGRTEGEVIANVGFQYVQNVKNTRKKSGRAVFNEAVSISTFVSVAEQKYVDNGTYLLRPSSSVSSSKVTYGDTVYSLSADTYGYRYGTIPNELCKYIINDETIADAKFVGKENDKLVYEYNFLPDGATLYSRNEMKYMADSPVYPSFKSVSMRLTMSEDWIVDKMTTYESYTITSFGFTNVPCNSALTETFSYINDPQPFPEKEIFESLVPGEGGEEEKPKSPVDYLAGAFGKYLAGAPLELNAKLDVLGMNIDAVLALNLSNYNVDALIGNLFVSYRGDNVFLKLNSLKGYLPTEKFGEIAALLPLGDLDLGGILDDPDLLAGLFANATLETTGDITSIHMPFELMGIGFDVTIRVNEAGGEKNLDSISAVINLADKQIKAEITPAINPVFPTVDSSYSDLSPLLGIVKPLLNTLQASNYDLSLNGSFGDLSLNLKALINKTEKGADVDIKANLLGAAVNVKYVDGSLYLDAGNIKLKASQADFDNISDLLKGLMPELGAMDILALLPSDINEILGVLENIEILSETSFRITLNVGGERIALSAAHDGEVVRSLELDGTLKAQPFSLSLDLVSINSNADITVNSPQSYVPLSALLEYLPAMQKLLSANTFNFKLNLTVSGGLQLAAGCDIIISKTAGGADLLMSFNIDGAAATLTVKQNTVYFKLNDVRLKFDLKDTDKLIEALKPFLPASAIGALDSLIGSSDGVNLYQILKMISDKDILNILISSVDSFEADGNSIRLGVSISGAQLDLSFNKSGDSISSLTALFSLNGTAINATVGVTSLSQEFSDIVTPSGEYIDALEFTAFIEPLVNTLNATGYQISGSFTLSENGADLPVDIALKLNRLQSGIEMKGELNLLGIRLELAFSGGEVYVKAGNLRLKLDTSKLGELVSEIEKLFPLPSLELPSVSVGDILNMIRSLSLSGDKLSLTLQFGETPVTVALTKGSDKLESLTVSDINVGTMTLNNLIVSLNGIGLNADMEVADKQEYSNVVDLVKLIGPIKNLLTYKTFDFNINAKIIGADNTNTDITGKVVISLREGGFDADILINAFDQQIGLKLIGGVMYLKINNIKLMMAGSDINGLIDGLAPYMPQYMTDLLRQALGGNGDVLSGITDLLGLQLPSFENGIIRGLAEISESGLVGNVLSMIEYLHVTAEGLDAGISVNGSSFNFSAAVGGGNLSGLTIGGFIKDTALDLSVGFNRLSTDSTSLTVAEPETYVDIMDIATYIDPVVNTINQKNFDLNLKDFVIDNADSKITVNGNAKISPTFTEIEGQNFSSFIDLYLDLRISIFNKKAVSGQVATLYHSFQLTLKDLGLNQNKNIYLLYSSQAPDKNGNVSYKKYKLDYFSILEILDGVRSILSIKSPLLDDLIGDHKLNASTGIFNTLNIGGLDSIKTALNDMLNTAGSALDLLDRVKRGFAAYMASTSLEEMLSQLKAIFSGVQMPGVSIDTDMIKKIFTTSIAFDKTTGDFTVNFDNSLLTPAATDFGHITLSKTQSLLKGVSLNNVNFGGTTVGGNLTLTCPESIAIAEPSDKDETYDKTPDADYNKSNLFNNFSSAKYLIEDVLNTANLKEFEISAIANLKVPVIANLDIPINAKVKILPNGKTVAAIKLEVPNNGGMLYTLRKSDSYIFFYEDRLYFMRDLYDCNFFITKHWYNGTTNIRSCTPQEFLNDPFPYIFFLLPLANSVTGLIPTDSKPDLSMAPPSLDSALNRYSYSKSSSGGKEYYNYNLNLSLSKLTRNTSLGDLQLNLSTQRFTNAEGIDMRLLSKVYLFCEIVTAIPITLNGNLINIDFNTGKSTGLSPVTFGYKYPNETTAIDNLGIAIGKIFGTANSQAA